MSGPYISKVNRRTTIKWIGATMWALPSASAAAWLHYRGANAESSPTNPPVSLIGAGPISGEGYGQDPDLLNPIVPWSRTMSQTQLHLAAALCDTIIPRDQFSPSASDVGVPDFIDEWVSAPYPLQQWDREVIFDGFKWVEALASQHFGTSFVGATQNQKLSICNEVAYPKSIMPEFNENGWFFFPRIQSLTVVAFYTTHEGMKDIGYVGNRPIIGDYPGPTPEALTHLEQALTRLGLVLLR